MDKSYGYVQQSPQRENTFSRKFVFVVAGGILALILGSVLLMSSGQNPTGKQVQALIIRLETLQTMLSDTKTTRNLKDQQLADISTSLSLTVTSDINELTTALAADYPEKIDQAVVANETDTTTATALEEAYLENELDSVYRDILMKKIASLRALLSEIHGLTKSESLRTTLANIDKHFSEANDQLESIDP